MTIKELKEELDKYPDDLPVTIYHEPNPYKEASRLMKVVEADDVCIDNGEIYDRAVIFYS